MRRGIGAGTQGWARPWREHLTLVALTTHSGKGIARIDIGMYKTVVSFLHRIHLFGRPYRCEHFPGKLQLYLGTSIIRFPAFLSNSEGDSQAMPHPHQSSLWIWLSLLAFALLGAVTFHRTQLPFVKLNDLTAAIADDVLSSPLHNASDLTADNGYDRLTETDIRDESEEAT